MEAKERIEKLQRYTKLRWKELAEKLGIAYAQTFTDIKNGKCGISKSLAAKIIATFPELNPDWVRLGIGDMFITEGEGTPYYKGGLINATEYIELGSFFPNADAALLNTSDSMAEYPEGCILILRLVRDMSLILPGLNYVVETNEFVSARKIQKGGGNDTIRLYSTNTERYSDGKLIYEPAEIPVSAIIRVFRIIGYIMVQDINMS